MLVLLLGVLFIWIAFLRLVKPPVEVIKERRPMDRLVHYRLVSLLSDAVEKQLDLLKGVACLDQLSVLSNVSIACLQKLVHYALLILIESFAIVII